MICRHKTGTRLIGSDACFLLCLYLCPVLKGDPDIDPIDPAAVTLSVNDGETGAGDGESDRKTGSPAKPSAAVLLGRGGSTERGSFRPLSEAMDAQSLPTRGQAEPSSDFVGLGSAGKPAHCGQKPTPTFELEV